MQNLQNYPSRGLYTNCKWTPTNRVLCPIQFGTIKSFASSRSLGKNAQHWSTIGGPLSLETPMNASLVTPIFMLEAPYFRWRISNLHWRPPDFHWRPPKFYGRPQDKKIKFWESQMKISKSIIKIWGSPMNFLGSAIQIWGSPTNYGVPMKI